MTKENKNVVFVDEEKVKEFIANSTNEVHQKEEVVEMCSLVENKINRLNSKLDDLQNAINGWDELENVLADEEPTFYKEYGTKDNAIAQFELIEKERNQWNKYLSQIQEMSYEHEVYDKMLCFSNIRELLRKNPEVKIGQIEKEAGIRLGYMARLDKEDNTAEPSLKFVLTAAKLLKVSVEALVLIDFKGLTQTEEYLVDFIKKLITNTLEDKLDWNVERASDLNHGANISIDEHPLFDFETIGYEQMGGGYPEPVNDVVFKSKSFGVNTYIHGDCYNLRLKNGAKLYLMDIEKSNHEKDDDNAFAKEAWLFVPHKGAHALMTTDDHSTIASQLELLYETVKERMAHVKVTGDDRYYIDSFMNDDIDDDVAEEVPELPFY